MSKENEMTDREALDRLIEAVEAGTLTWPEAQSWGHNAIAQASLVWSAYHGSLDAAKALHEAILPGWVAEIKVGLSDSPSRVILYRSAPSSGESSSVTEWANNPARAWLLAILKALRETN